MSKFLAIYQVFLQIKHKENETQTLVIANFCKQGANFQQLWQQSELLSD